MSILHVQNLTKQFRTKTGTFTAVNDISFILDEGEVLGILGPNGAGKTTVIQMLLSVLQPTAGSITYFGKNFFMYRSEILERVSFASTYVRLPAQLTVRTNLDIFAQLYGIPSHKRKERIEQHLKFFGMWNLADKETGVLSAGQMTRVMLAKAFITDPKIVLLDEPTASLDPDIAQDVRAFIQEQQKQFGVSIVLTSHNMEEVSYLCDRALVLKNGIIIANNTPEKLALSVSRARVNLIAEKPALLISYLEKTTHRYHKNDPIITIECDENAIAELLMNLARAGINYTQISIDTPTLHDYFLSIARDS
jgi:ABC-2 type transport system ATP-binding protein